MPAGGITLKSHSDILSYEKITDIVKSATHLGITKIRITGGEPLVRRNIEDLIRGIKDIEGITEVAMTTNGMLLAGKADILKRSGLDRINISLDTVRPGLFRRITRCGDIDAVFRGITAAKEAGFTQIKINTVILTGINDTLIHEMREFCATHGLKLQRINHYTLNGYQKATESIRLERPLPCSSCNRIRLTADGMLKPCLLSNIEIPIDFDDIESSLIEAITQKPEQGKRCTTRGNWQIGG
jgi:cyclic pyranopterin phosphate synthase